MNVIYTSIYKFRQKYIKNITQHIPQCQSIISECLDKQFLFSFLDVSIVSPPQLKEKYFKIKDANRTFLPACAGDTGLIPGRERFHMPQSN